MINQNTYKVDIPEVKKIYTYIIYLSVKILWCTTTFFKEVLRKGSSNWTKGNNGKVRSCLKKGVLYIRRPLYLRGIQFFFRSRKAL